MHNINEMLKINCHCVTLNHTYLCFVKIGVKASKHRLSEQKIWTRRCECLWTFIVFAYARKILYNSNIYTIRIRFIQLIGWNLNNNISKIISDQINNFRDNQNTLITYNHTIFCVRINCNNIALISFSKRRTWYIAFFFFVFLSSI